MCKLVTVMNVLTEDKMLFSSSHILTIEDCLVSAIICSFEDSRKLLSSQYRDKIKAEAKISKIHSKNGSVKYYSEAYDMIAYESTHLD